MRVSSTVLRIAMFCLAPVFAGQALATEETQLIDSINSYRNQSQGCAGQASLELPPLSSDPRLVLSITDMGNLQQQLSRTAYPMVNVQAISLSGPRDAAAAMQAIRESFCQVVLDPQFVDIGVSRVDREWRIVVARPLLSARLGDWNSEGQKLLDAINAARAKPQQCGTQAMAATTPLVWNETLAQTAQGHSRAMANQNFFDHIDREGRTPGDRADLAGYSGQGIAENIAAGLDSPRKVLDGWLSSPGHCTNLMNPQLRELGAAYATDPKSDAGIYWTALFGTP